MEELSNEQIWELSKLLNESDGEKTSEYLHALIEENKNNEISTEEIIKRLKEYYEKRDKR